MAKKREIYIIFILSVKELWKNFGRENFGRLNLLSELFMRPNFFVIIVFIIQSGIPSRCYYTSVQGYYLC